ncbi:hypothetical protein GF314_07690 [bacterium]|nr:hypothetical protein [bacterium]
MAASDELAALRSERRAQVRAGTMAKAGTPGEFGLLVIPVDFRDRRYASPPALDDRLDGGPGSLVHYFDVASQGRTRLHVVTTDVVSLPGDRLDYSDLDLQGTTRLEALATGALAGAVSLGASFADVDRDGDGEVDGVLILHAAAGLENDPDGLIAPVQYFLTAPVSESGTRARLFAVAAARSSLGLWAHETAHLLGLEERYDVLLPASSEMQPRGGLGRFSLMASGWIGSGDGTDPALPDAYSRLQLGWVDLADTLGHGTVVRLRSSLSAPDRHMLVERRDGPRTAPYDVWATDDRAVAYRIDEAYAEGEVGGPPGARWQRVELLEADGDDDVRQGTSDGDVSDLFPTDGTSQDLAADTVPGSGIHAIADTGIRARFTVVDGRAVVEDLNMLPWADVRVAFPDGGADGEVTVVARVDTAPAMPVEITVRLEPWPMFWGAFETASGLETMVEVTLVPSAGSGWANYALAGPLRWRRTDDVPDGAVTPMAITVLAGATGHYTLAYPWDTDHAPLDIDAAWTDRWRRYGTVATNSWYRWPDAPGGAPAAGPVLACVAAADSTGAGWPAVRYANGAWSRLVTPPLGHGVAWVGFTHAVDVEVLYPGRAVDAATITWVAPSGTRVPAAPQDGWIGACDPRSGHELAGAPAFAVADSLRDDLSPVWRAEVVPVPDPARHGPGPWRLAFEFASNAVWRGRGWLLRDVSGDTSTPPDAFPVRLGDGVLTWQPPLGHVTTSYRIQRRADDGRTWVDLQAVPAGQRTVTLDALGIPLARRVELRVVAEAGPSIVSRAVVATGTAGTGALGAPRPNPAAGLVRFDVDPAGSDGAELVIYDRRGRRIWSQPVAGGPGQVVWDGRDARGRRVASGLYIVRLEGEGWTRTRQVTWLH